MECATLLEVCTVNRSNVRAHNTEENVRSASRVFPVVGSGAQPYTSSSVWNAEHNTIIISRKGCFGRVSRYDYKTLVTGDAYFLTDISTLLDPNYLYHFLGTVVNHKLTRKRDRSVLTCERLENIVVVYPDIEKQRDIAAFFDVNEYGGLRSEPPELMEIRQIVAQSNKDIVALLKNPPSLCQQSCRWKWCLFLFCVLIVISCLLRFTHEQIVENFWDEAKVRMSYFTEIMMTFCGEVSNRLQQSALLYSPFHIER